MLENHDVDSVGSDDDHKNAVNKPTCHSLYIQASSSDWIHFGNLVIVIKQDVDWADRFGHNVEDNPFQSV